MLKQLKYGKNWSKTAEISEISPNSPKYRAHGFKNSFNALPVAQNPMLEKRILDLSPIGKKLGGPYLVLGRHLGFGPKMRVNGVGKFGPAGFVFFNP